MATFNIFARWWHTRTFGLATSLWQELNPLCFYYYLELLLLFLATSIGTINTDLGSHKVIMAFRSLHPICSKLCNSKSKREKRYYESWEGWFLKYFYPTKDCFNIWGIRAPMFHWTISPLSGRPALLKARTGKEFKLDSGITKVLDLYENLCRYKSFINLLIIKMK